MPFPSTAIAKGADAGVGMEYSSMYSGSVPAAATKLGAWVGKNIANIRQLKQMVRNKLL